MQIETWWAKSGISAYCKFCEKSSAELKKATVTHLSEQWVRVENALFCKCCKKRSYAIRTVHQQNLETLKSNYTIGKVDEAVPEVVVKPPVVLTLFGRKEE